MEKKIVRCLAILKKYMVFLYPHTLRSIFHRIFSKIEQKSERSQQFIIDFTTKERILTKIDEMTRKFSDK